MHGFLDTAGERVEIVSELPWVTRLMEEGAGGELRRSGPSRATIGVRVDADHHPFDLEGWEPLTRGAWTRSGEVVVEDPCTAGFDLHLRCDGGRADFTFRWRPPARSRAAGRVLRSRFHLLARAVLIQFPALWWAGTRGRAPLHASVCTAGAATPMLAGPGGVGKSTLVAAELAAGGRAIGDNLCVGDGRAAWGLVEPLRIEGGPGRRMPHGRREAAMPGRVLRQEPDRILVIRRGGGNDPTVRSCEWEVAARSLVAGTYMAGELRRYWAFASTLAAGTGAGPAHPPVAEVAARFARRLPCFEVVLAGTPGGMLTDLLEPAKERAWT